MLNKFIKKAHNAVGAIAFVFYHILSSELLLSLDPLVCISMSNHIIKTVAESPEM